MRIAINGFGRIGRAILRQILTTTRGEGVEIVLINDIAPLDICAGQLSVLGQKIPFCHEADLTRVDLSSIDVVLDCTGIARSSDVAQRGLAAGASKVLISGPSPAAELTVVYGANEDQLGAARIVSNASCTTNGLAPLVKLVACRWCQRPPLLPI